MASNSHHCHLRFVFFLVLLTSVAVGVSFSIPANAQPPDSSVFTVLLGTAGMDPKAINNAGQILVQSGDNPFQAFLLSATSITPIDVPVPTYHGSYDCEGPWWENVCRTVVAGINDAGQIVGSFTFTHFSPLPFPVPLECFRGGGCFLFGRPFFPPG